MGLLQRFVNANGLAVDVTQAVDRATENQLIELTDVVQQAGLQLLRAEGALQAEAGKVHALIRPNIEQ